MMIVKHIPFSAYQVKTVNYRQLIQAPLKYFDNYFDGCRHSRWLLVQNLMAKSGVLESWSHRSWSHGVMELWSHGVVDLWSRGFVESCSVCHRLEST